MKKGTILSLGGLASLLLISCNSLVTVQKKGLYDQDPNTASAAGGSREMMVFNDEFDNYDWVSPEANCVQLKVQKDVVYSGKTAIHLTWDKITGHCKWIGVGFGSGSWSSNDLIDLSQTAALQMQVKSGKGSFKNLPVAFALEDNYGIQSYCGFTMDLASGEFNDKTWTTVTIPLTKFNFTKQDFNLEKVTQFIIQLEADGDIYLDNIKFITIKNG
jgi:hypothetical protein